MTTAGITNTTAAMILAISSGTGVMAQTTPFAVFDRASEPVLNDPHDLEIGPDGMLYVADKFHNRITVMDPQTLEVTGTFGDGQLIGAHDISFGPDGSAHVAVTGLGLVATYDFPDGEAKLRNVIEGLYRTEGALAHSNGRIYAMISATGELVSIENGQAVASAEGMYGAHDVAEAPDGSIWVADNGARRLLHYSEELELLQTLDGPQFGFVGPRYLDVDDLGRLVIADQDAHRILMIDPEAETVLGVIGDGSPGLGPNRLDDPEGVEIHGTEYYFSDSDNNRIVKYVVVVN